MPTSQASGWMGTGFCSHFLKIAISLSRRAEAAAQMSREGVARQQQQHRNDYKSVAAQHAPRGCTHGRGGGGNGTSAPDGDGHSTELGRRSFVTSSKAGVIHRRVTDRRVRASEERSQSEPLRRRRGTSEPAGDSETSDESTTFGKQLMTNSTRRRRTSSTAPHEHRADDGRGGRRRRSRHI